MSSASKNWEACIPLILSFLDDPETFFSSLKVSKTWNYWCKNPLATKNILFRNCNRWAQCVASEDLEPMDNINTVETFEFDPILVKFPNLETLSLVKILGSEFVFPLMPRLRNLTIYINSSTGGIYWRPGLLSNLTNLKRLKIVNKTQEIVYYNPRDKLPRLENLEVVGFWQSQMWNLFDETVIKHLQVSTLVTQPYGGVPNLKTLQVQTLGSFPLPPKLEILVITGDTNPLITKLENLKSLSLRMVNLVTYNPGHPNYLSPEKFPNLKKLVILDGKTPNPEWLLEFPHLEHLEIHGAQTPISAPTRKLKNLKYFELKNPNFTDAVNPFGRNVIFHIVSEFEVPKSVKLKRFGGLNPNNLFKNW